MFLVQKDCNKIPALNLTVGSVSPVLTLSGTEAVPSGTIANTETFIAPLTTVILPKWVVTLNKLHKVSCFL